MTKIILVRHGQTVWNHEMKYQGHSDIALTEDGVEQARQVAKRLACEGIAAVYSSDLSRAFLTAKHIAGPLGLPVTAMPELREIQFGKWEGMRYDEIREEWPELLKQLFTRPDEVEIPGGETFRQLKERASQAIHQLIDRHPDQTIAVVSHGGTIRTIICDALNIHLNYVWSIRQDNTAVNMIEYYPDRTIVTLMNDIHHLETCAANSLF